MVQGLGMVIQSASCHCLPQKFMGDEEVKQAFMAFYKGKIA